jgi:hypothetical protein
MELTLWSLVTGRLHIFHTCFFAYDIARTPSAYLFTDRAVMQLTLFRISRYVSR